MKRIIRLVPFFVVLAVLIIGMALPAAGQSPDDTKVYLPFAGRSMTQGPGFHIYSWVTIYPPEDINPILTLDFFDGITTTPIMSTTKGSDGLYLFRNLPLPENGQYYQVTYYNGRYGQPYDDDKITIVKTPPITSIVEGVSIYGGFLILNPIRLAFPSDGRQYANAHPVQWYERYGHTLVSIYDLAGNLLYETEPTLFTTAHLFSPLPSELEFDTPYIWEVSIRNPDGSIGIDTKARREIIFVEEEPLPAPTGLRNQCDGPKWRYYYCDYFWDSLGVGTEYSLYGGNDEDWITDTQFTNYEACELPRTWQVRARNETAESTWSESVTFTPPDCPCEIEPCFGKSD